jgi:hypothetical protein
VIHIVLILNFGKNNIREIIIFPLVFPIKKRFEEFVKSNDSWIGRIPSDTLALVLGAGSWYCHWQGLLN